MLLTSGNTAKLYCLDWLEQYLTTHHEPLKILDLGCGEALNFVKLLAKYAPQVSYVGVEPNAQDCQLARENLRGLPATVINSPAEKVGRKLEGQFDLVVSFSALEHVYHRLAFLQTAKQYLAPDGYFLLNYDAGHFVNGRERLKNLFGPLLAVFGLEQYYQSFVTEAEFQRLIQFVGLEIVDQKFFNTKLKGLAKVIPPEKRAEFTHRWLECELWLNTLTIKYTDDLANLFETRNFILRPKK